MNSKKTLVGVVHRRADDELIDTLKPRDDVETYTVTPANRGDLDKKPLKEVVESIGEHL